MKSLLQFTLLLLSVIYVAFPEARWPAAGTMIHGLLPVVWGMLMYRLWKAGFLTKTPAQIHERLKAEPPTQLHGGLKTPPLEYLSCLVGAVAFVMAP